MKKLEDDAGYDPSNWTAAVERSTIWGEEIPIGKFFERTDLPSLHEADPVTQSGPMVGRPDHIDPAAAQFFIEELM